jgi:SAM-dependent methyltransferase
MAKEGTRTAYSYETLSLLGKLSLRLSHRAVVSHLRPGPWLDVLSGHQSLLQRSQLGNPAITAFHSIDRTLDVSLASDGVNLTELVVDRELPYAADSFANVTIINGLEHLWHPREILAESRRVLEPGGALQVIVPTWFGKPFLEFLAFRMNNPQARIEMDDHKMYYDEKTLWPMLVEAGFRPRNIVLRRIKLYCSLYARATKPPAEP